MGDQNINIRIIEVKNPWSFRAVKTDGSGSKSQDEQKYDRMLEEMHEYFELTLGQGMCPSKSLKGDICAAQKRENGSWQRVKILDSVKTGRGQQARCFAIDTGEEFMTSLLRLQCLPSKFKEFPAQVRQCSLWGVQPISLAVTEADTGLVAKNRPCHEWDPSAIHLMRKLVAENDQWQAEVVGEDPENVLYLRLYFHTESGLVCFNEKLVNENYAVNNEPTHQARPLKYIDSQKLEEDQACKPDRKSSTFSMSSDKSKHSFDGEDMPSLIPDLLDSNTETVVDEADNKALLIEKTVKDFFNQASDVFKYSSPEKSPHKAVYATELEKELLSPPRVSESGNLSPKCSNNSSVYSITPEKQTISERGRSFGRGSPLGRASLLKFLSPEKEDKNRTNSCSSPLKNEKLVSFPGGGRGNLLNKIVQAQKQVQSSTDKHQVSPYQQSPIKETVGRSPPSSQFADADVSLQNFSGSNTNKNARDSTQAYSNVTSAPDLDPYTENRKWMAMGARPKIFSSCTDDSDDGKRPKKKTAKVPDTVTENWFRLDSSISPDSRLLKTKSGPKPDDGSMSSDSLSCPSEGVRLRYGHSKDPLMKPKTLKDKSPVTSPLKDQTVTHSEMQKKYKRTSGGSSDGSISDSPSSCRNQYKNSISPLMEMEESREMRAQIRESKDKYAGKIEGNKLLSLLKKKSGQTTRETTHDIIRPMTNRPDKQVTTPYLGVIVHGKNQPPIQTNTGDLPFKQNVIKQMLNNGYDYPCGVQGIVWPAITACRHIVGISTNQRQGKIMEYVPAIVSHLTDQINYVELPKGKGPQALIIVPSWRKAKEVYEHVTMFTGANQRHLTQLRVIVLYAGGTEDSESTITDLIRGCEILIATPNSFLRTLSNEVTSLKRVCHLVLDDADILSTRFDAEIHELIQKLKIVFNTRKQHSTSPKQIMIFANKWNDDVARFQESYTKEPIIAFSSRIEAAVYGGVKQVVKICKSNNKLTTFCGLLDSLASTSTGEKVIAFTETVEDAIALFQASRSRGIYSLIIHQKLEPEDLVEENRRLWLESARSKELTVLVCTDMCYQDLSATNATAVIHYGLPVSKTKFGNRLACMLDYFVDKTQPKQTQQTRRGTSVEPVSHVIVTEDSAERARSLLDFLYRCKAKIPAQLSTFVKKFQESVDNDERKPLCTFIKAFGECINKDKCGFRHILLPEQDLKTGQVTKNTLPAQGEVTVQVIRVVNATHYYCHLLTHQPQPTVKENLRSQFQELMLDMTSYFCNRSNQVPFVPSADCYKDGLCALKDKDDIFKRAKVVETKAPTAACPMLQCKVWLVDDAVHKWSTVDQLVKLPKEMADIPYQAIEVYVCRVRPMDNDTDWTDKADRFAQQLVEKKEFTGVIVLSLGLTLWLDPLVHQVVIKNVGKANDHVIRQELLANKFGISNTNHIQQLYEVCRGKTEIPEKIMRKYFDYCLEIELMQETLTSSTSFHEVLIRSVFSPDLFYVQKSDTFDRFEKLEAEIADEMDSVVIKDEQNKADSEMLMEEGSVCLAQSTDNSWYRGKVIECVDDKFNIFFLDYGDKEWVPSHSVRPLPRKFSDLPCQAIECKLAFIEPKGRKWTGDANEVILDLAHFVRQEFNKKDLYAKVIDRIDSEFSMSQKLVIDLYDTTAGDVQFSQVLVWRHMADFSEDSEGNENMKVLIGKPALKNQLFFNPLDKIPYLCANIYWSESDEEAVSQAQELNQLLHRRVPGWDKAMDQRGVLPKVMQVLGYLNSVKAHRLLIEGLTSCCKDSARVCEIFLDNDLINRLVYCLEQESRPEIQIQALLSIKELLSQPSFVEESCVSGLAERLSHFLDRCRDQGMEDSSEAASLVCKASAKLILQSDKGSCEQLKSTDTVELILRLLPECKRDEEKEPWLELLGALSQSCPSIHPFLMKESFLEVLMDVLCNLRSQKCLAHMLSIMHCLAHENRKNKRVLLEHKLLIVLSDLLEQGLVSPARELCQQLQETMTIQMPQQEVLAGVPTQRGKTVGKVICPQVTWMENCFRVVLTVKIKNASINDFHIFENRLFVSSRSEGVLHELDWELYGLIEPEKCKVKPFAADTNIVLRKITKGIWGRLVKQKTKPSCLSLDYDKIYDSDEEEIDDDNAAKLATEKSRFAGISLEHVQRLKLYDTEESDSSDLAIFSEEERDEPVIDSDIFLRKARILDLEQ